MPDLKRLRSPVHQPVMFDWASACGTPVPTAAESEQERGPVGELLCAWVGLAVAEGVSDVESADEVALDDGAVDGGAVDEGTEDEGAAEDIDGGILALVEPLFGADCDEIGAETEALLAGGKEIPVTTTESGWLG